MNRINVIFTEYILYIYKSSDRSLSYSFFNRSPTITNIGVNYVTNTIQANNLRNLQLLSLTFW